MLYIRAQENTERLQVKTQPGNLEGDKKPRTRNKNQKTKILRTHGENGPTESLTESVHTIV